MSAADRQRRHRSRRRAGRLIVPVEVDGAILDALAWQGYTADIETDRRKLGEAVGKLLKQIVKADDIISSRVTRMSRGS